MNMISRFDNTKILHRCKTTQGDEGKRDNVTPAATRLEVNDPAAGGSAYRSRRGTLHHFRERKI